jgi:hypothetical protein
VLASWKLCHQWYEVYWNWLAAGLALTKIVFVECVSAKIGKLTASGSILTCTMLSLEFWWGLWSRGLP